jgi:hypothetical protein
MKQLITLLTILLIADSKLSAQWTTSSTNIYNSNTGNVGIGTTAPNAKLQVIGNAIIGQNIAGANAVRVDVTSGASTQDAKIDFGYYTTFDVSHWNMGRWGVDGSFRISDYSGGSEANRLTINTAGNIGIGTSTPVEKLNLKDGNLSITSSNAALNTVMGTMKISYLTTPNAYAGIAGRTNGGGLDQLDLLFYTAFGTASEKMRIMSNSGNVGIGTAAPAYKLDVNGTTRINGTFALMGTQQAPNYILGNETADNAQLLIKSGSSASVFSQIEVTGNWNGTANTGGKVAFTTAGAERLRIDAIGNIGIGTSAPNAKLDVIGNIFCNNKVYIGTYDGTTNTQIASYSLAVNGTAIFNKAKVKLYGNWPDYVFEDKYNLMPLTEVEKFLKINKHLPEVPSAAEVEKDGIDLGDNQSILLKKVEELTLYMIDQNKKIAIQQSEINNLKNQVILLQKK